MHIYIFTIVGLAGIGWSVMGRLRGKRKRTVVRYIILESDSERNPHHTANRRCCRRVVNRHVSVGIKKVLCVDFTGAARRATIFLKLLNPFRVLRKL